MLPLRRNDALNADALPQKRISSSTFTVTTAAASSTFMVPHSPIPQQQQSPPRTKRTNQAKGFQIFLQKKQPELDYNATEISRRRRSRRSFLTNLPFIPSFRLRKREKQQEKEHEQQTPNVRSVSFYLPATEEFIQDNKEGKHGGRGGLPPKFSSILEDFAVNAVDDCIKEEEEQQNQPQPSVDQILEARRKEGNLWKEVKTLRTVEQSVIQRIRCSIRQLTTTQHCLQRRGKNEDTEEEEKQQLHQDADNGSATYIGESERQPFYSSSDRSMDILGHQQRISLNSNAVRRNHMDFWLDAGNSAGI